MRIPRLTRQIIPVAVSLALFSWVVWWVSPQEFVRATSELDWRRLLPATTVLVFSLYFWDALCLPTVYGVAGCHWGYRQAIHLRGLSYVFGAWHYELGQAALAWGAARLQRTDVVPMLARSVVLIYHDIVVLLGLGFIGAMLTDDPRVERLRPLIAIGLTGALLLAMTFWILPSALRSKLRGKRIETLFKGWSLRRSLKLIPLRVGYFGILIVYAAVALHICRLPVDHHVVLSTIPLVMLADGLPNVAGLGTRDATMQLLLKPAQPEILFAMSLIWSTGLLVGRTAIGLAHLWGQQLLYGSIADLPPADESR